MLQQICSAITLSAESRSLISKDSNTTDNYHQEDRWCITVKPQNQKCSLDEQQHWWGTLAKTYHLEPPEDVCYQEMAKYDYEGGKLWFSSTYKCN